MADETVFFLSCFRQNQLRSKPGIATAVTLSEGKSDPLNDCVGDEWGGLHLHIALVCFGASDKQQGSFFLVGTDFHSLKERIKKNRFWNRNKYVLNYRKGC